MRVRRASAPAVVEELNLVPYMDIMTNLVMFILVSMTSFIDMNAINVSAPTYCETCGGNGAPRHDITVAIVQGKGFTVSMDGRFVEGTVDGLTAAGRADAPYPFADLTRKMSEVKRLAGPTTSSVTLAADRGVDYQTLVRTMDALRRDPAGAAMFPDVTLAAP